MMSAPTQVLKLTILKFPEKQDVTQYCDLWGKQNVTYETSCKQELPFHSNVTTLGKKQNWLRGTLGQWNGYLMVLILRF